MINHISIKQVWLEKKYYIDKKNVQKRVNQKMFKNPMKKRFYIIYQRTKVQKVGSIKNEGVKKNLTYYIK